MVFTVQKLRRSLEALSGMIEGPEYTLKEVVSSVAAGPMVLAEEHAEWESVEVGQSWGVRHGTSWLKVELNVPETMQGGPLVLQLHWDSADNDALLIRLEATVFL